MITNNLDLNAMGLVSLNEAEMLETEGGIKQWQLAAIAFVVCPILGVLIATSTPAY